MEFLETGSHLNIIKTKTKTFLECIEVKPQPAEHHSPGSMHGGRLLFNCIQLFSNTCSE